MTPVEFGVITQKIKPYTDYIYLHVMGEPLLHPGFEEMLLIAREAKLNVNITTNGSLINSKKAILLNNPIRQINISLHDAEENIPAEQWDSYLDSVFNFATEAAPATYINLRLWNAGVNKSTAFNLFVLDKIARKFDKSLNDISITEKDKGIKLAPHIFLQHAARFEWPDGEETRTGTTKTCYALRDQIAVLADGTVVPCCLDADAHLKLGNIFSSGLSEILSSERAIKIRNGFINNKITEDFCRSCGFFI